VPADPQRPLPHLGTPTSGGSRPVVLEDQDQVLARELEAFPAEDEPVWEVLEYLDYLDYLDDTEPGDGEPCPTDLPGPVHGDYSAVAAAGAGFGHGGAADTMAPGPVLADLTDQVWQQGLGGLDDDELTGVLVAWQRLGARAAAGLLAAVSELAARRRAEGQASGDWRAFEHTEDEIAAALTVTRHGAGCVVALALGLDRLPLTSAALAAGLIDERRATVITDELAGLDDEHAAAVEALIIGKAAGQTTGQLRPAVHRAVIAADPAAAKRRKEEALKDARVEASSQPSGTATLAGRDLPPAGVLAADKHLTALAQAMKKAGAEGTMNQLRARAYLHLLAGQPAETLLTSAAGAGTAGTGTPGTGTAGTAATGTAGTGTAGTRTAGTGTAGARTAGAGAVGLGLPVLCGTVNLTVPLATWLGWSQSPGQIPGFGTLDADDSRAIADLLGDHPATRWCITLTDPVGRPVAHGCAKNGPRPRGTPGSGPGSRAGPGFGPGPGSRAGPGFGPEAGPRLWPSDDFGWISAVTITDLETGTCTHQRETPAYHRCRCSISSGSARRPVRSRAAAAPPRAATSTTPWLITEVAAPAGAT
jgi:hypothetical protein